MDFAIGIDLGGTNLRLGGVQRNTDILGPVKVPAARFASTPDLISGIAREVGTIAEAIRKQGGKVLGAGMGAPGGVSPDGEIVYFSPNYPEWKNLPLRRLLEDEARIPVRIDNDANTWAYGEGWTGAGRDARHFVLITLGTGVGGGVVIDGKIHRGHSGIAAEIGHTTIEPDGAPCECGGRGCLETIASAKGIIRMAREFISQGEESILAREGSPPFSSKDVFEAALAGDRLSLRVMDQVGRALGIGVANIINVLNPELVILGGGVSAARELFGPAMSEEIKRRAFSDHGKKTPVVPPRLGENSGILGAARLILEHGH